MFGQRAAGQPEGQITLHLHAALGGARLKEGSMRAELGFLAGLGAGVTAGLLFAPTSGKQTRRLIAQKARSGMDEVSAAGKKLRAQAVSLADEARERVKEVVGAGKEAYRTAV